MMNRPARYNPLPGICDARVYPDGSFRSFSCGRPAKWLVRITDGTERRVCGIHVRKYRPELIVGPA